jgi:hypothetical protein
MDGFEGPFRFEIDSEGTDIPWDTLDESIKRELLSDGNITEKTSKVYLFKIIVSPYHRRLERHHKWEQVTRIFIEARVGHSLMRLGGISPRNKRSIHARQIDMGFDVKGEGEINLFELARFKLIISRHVKEKSSETRMAILSSCTKKVAKWVYSRGWPYLDYKKFVYVAVPDFTPVDDRYLAVFIKAVRKDNIEVTQVAVHGHHVQLGSAV